MGKVLNIIYCEICKRPTHRRGRRYTRTGRRPLCLLCWRKYSDSLDWSRWP